MNRNTFERYIQEFCEDLAHKQNYYSHKQHHACVITYNNAIISSGININLKNDFTRVYNDLKAMHAEAVAIMRAISKHFNVLHKSEIWICRVNKSLLNSKPCPMCTRIIKTFRIPVMHYTDENGIWVTENIKLY